MNNRWKAYQMVDNYKQLSDMEKDYIRNCIVSDSDKRIKGQYPAKIISRAIYRMIRSKGQRLEALGKNGRRLLAISVV
jgi:hypothetical protein